VAGILDHRFNHESLEFVISHAGHARVGHFAPLFAFAQRARTARLASLLRSTGVSARLRAAFAFFPISDNRLGERFLALALPPKRPARALTFFMRSFCAT
jgi:hypothetical protein